MSNDEKTGAISFLPLIGLECVARSHEGVPPPDLPPSSIGNLESPNRQVAVAASKPAAPQPAEPSRETMRGSWLAILKAEHDEANAWDSGLEAAGRMHEYKVTLARNNA